MLYEVITIIIPKISDDESIDITEIKYDVENIRATLLNQRYSNKYKANIPDNIVQKINKLKITSVDSSRLSNSSIPLADIPDGKVLMRTQLQIPDILTKSSGNYLIKRISASTLMSKNFTMTTPEQAAYSGNGKFNSKNIFCFIEDNYIYLITQRSLFKSLKYIDLHAVFTRPTEVNSLLNNSFGFSLDDDDPYPVSEDMAYEIEEIILKKLNIQKSQIIDDINDSSDTSKQIKTK